MIAAGVFVLGSVLLIWDYHVSNHEHVDEIARNGFGKGKRTEELRVEAEERILGDIPIEVTEQIYEGQEITQILKQAADKMDRLILGENKSLDHVDRNLNLITAIPEKPIDVTWKLDRYDVMNIYGQLREEKLISEGVQVQLSAVLTYREDPKKQALYECAVMLYPKMDGEGGMLLEKIRLAVEQKNQDTRETEKLKLPQQVEGQKIHFYPIMNYRGAVLMMAAVVITVLLFALDKQNEVKERQKRK